MLPLVFRFSSFMNKGKKVTTWVSARCHVFWTRLRPRKSWLCWGHCGLGHGFLRLKTESIRQCCPPSQPYFPKPWTERSRSCLIPDRAHTCADVLAPSESAVIYGPDGSPAWQQLQNGRKRKLFITQGASLSFCCRKGGERRFIHR